MIEYSKQNKQAWEFNAYDFWYQNCTPQERAKVDMNNPISQLKKYASYFVSVISSTPTLSTNL